MKLRKLSALLLGSSLVLAPVCANAAIVVTNKNNTSSGGTTHSITSASFSANAGDIIVVHGGDRLAASGDVIVINGSVDGAFSAGNIQECRINAGANGGYSGWIKSVGGTQTITVSDGSGAANATSIQASVEVLTGVDQTTPEDTATRGACVSGVSNNGNAANPTGTSGSAAHANEAIISTYDTPTTAGYSPTIDAAFTNINTTCNAAACWSNAYLIKAGTGTQTRQDTVTIRNYSYLFMGFNAAAAGGTTTCSLLTEDIGDC